MTQDFNVILQRFVGEIKFRPTLNSFSQTANIINKFEEKFEDWQAPKSDNIVLYSSKNKNYLNLTYDTITYLNESNTSNTQEVFELFNSIYSKLTKDSGVQQIRRVGFRKTLFLSTKFKYSELVELIFKKFYSSSGSLQNISSDNFIDVIYALDGEKNGYSNHVLIGPDPISVALKRFNNSFDVGDKLPEYGLFVDVDVFTTQKLSVENSLEQFNGIVKDCERIVREYLEYISGPK